MTRKWLAVLPAGVGLITALMINRGMLQPVLYRYMNIRFFPMDILAFLVGLALSLLVITAIAIHAWGNRIRRQADEERRRFLGLLDHELKNPLNAIQAGLANLADIPNGAPRQDILTSIKHQTNQISRLVIDLRKVAELEERPLDATSVDVAELLQEIQEQVEERPERACRHLTFNVPMAPWPLPCVSGDRDLFFAAIYNLLDNALKFTRPGDRVEVRAVDDGTHIVVEVADTGPGIPDDEVPYVWEELYRGKAAHGVYGRGLGLALVRSVIKRHRGQATLHSRVGQGTIVKLRLPKPKVVESKNATVTER